MEFFSPTNNFVNKFSVRISSSHNTIVTESTCKSFARKYPDTTTVCFMLDHNQELKRTHHTFSYIAAPLSIESIETQTWRKAGSSRYIVVSILLGAHKFSKKYKKKTVS